MNQSGNGSSICTVCGYIHRGQIPEKCPVCGAPENRFEAHEKKEAQEQTLPTERWRCLVCNYIHDGDTPPLTCPVCSAPRKSFEAVLKNEPLEKSDGKPENFLIIGGGIAGISAAESIAQVSGNPKITLISKEKHLPYYRLNLTRLLAGEITEDQLPVHPAEWYEKKGITLISGCETTEISVHDKTVTTDQGDKFPYDKLVITAGAHPFIPAIPGSRMEGVCTLRTVEDAQFIKRSMGSSPSVIIVGGGVLGLEAAGAVSAMGGKVTVIENFDYLMPRQLTKTPARMLETFIRKLGISLITGDSIKTLLGDERVFGVKLNSGEELPADLVIFSTGVRSNSYLARLSGIQVQSGILVNDHLETSEKDIYAAGDISEHRGTYYGLWNAAQYQGSIAGLNAAGQTTEFGGIPRSNSLKVLGIDLFSIGVISPEDGSYLTLEDSLENNIYNRFIFHDSKLVGAILYGDTTLSAKVKQAIEKQVGFADLLSADPNIKQVLGYLKEIDM